MVRNILKISLALKVIGFYFDSPIEMRVKSFRGYRRNILIKRLSEAASSDIGTFTSSIFVAVGALLVSLMKYLIW